MTQHSLITRLKAVEEALAIAQDDVISFADDETNPEVKANLLRDVKRAEAALSDLRELIKEAEGKKPIACVALKRWESGNYWPDDCFVHSSSGDQETPLYTALGEKP